MKNSSYSCNKRNLEIFVPANRDSIVAVGVLAGQRGLNCLGRGLFTWENLGMELLLCMK